jgi:hypothetical protein
MSATREKLVVLDKKESTRAAKPKRRKKTGAAKMRKAADEVVGRDCEPIIDALSTNGKKGSIQSAKFLYELAHTAEESGEGENAEDFRNMALELANSPEWKGSPLKTHRDDEDQETDN